MGSSVSTQRQQRSNIHTSSSLSSTTITTTSSHHLLRQQYEVQPTVPSGHTSTWTDMYAMNQPMQERNRQIDIRPGETQSELLRRVLSEFGLPPHLLHEVRSSSRDARTASSRADIFVLHNQATQELTEVLFHQASSGSTYNVAVRSQQFNTAIGPGSRVYRNQATDSEQTNCSVCIVM